MCTQKSTHHIPCSHTTYNGLTPCPASEVLPCPSSSHTHSKTTSVTPCPSCLAVASKLAEKRERRKKFWATSVAEPEAKTWVEKVFGREDVSIKEAWVRGMKWKVDKEDVDKKGKDTETGKGKEEEGDEKDEEEEYTYEI